MKILSVDKDKAQVELTKEEFSSEVLTPEWQKLLKEEAQKVDEICNLGFESANFKLTQKANRRLEEIGQEKKRYSEPQYVNRRYKQAIRQALSEGKLTPEHPRYAEILAEYPELAKGKAKGKAKQPWEMTKAEVAILVKPTFSVPVGADPKSVIEKHKKTVELYDAIIGKLEGTLKEME